MRIGLFADRLARGDRQTGVGAYVAGLSTALAQANSGHDFTLCSTPERTVVDSSSYGGMPVEILPWPRRPVQAAWCLVGHPRVRQLRGPLDVLHVLVPVVPVPTSARFVATVHDLIPLKFPEFFSWRTRSLFSLAARQIRDQARRIITISSATRTDVVEILGVDESRVDVVPLAVPPQISRPSADAVRASLADFALLDRRFALFVGEVARRKNPVLLVDAFASVARELDDVQLVMAGSPGNSFEDVVERVAALRLGERVRLLGHVPTVQLNALMSAAGVFVLPSAYEGFGLPALEAMASGTPVVTSDAGSLPEVIGDAGILVPAGDAEALAESMLAVLSNAAVQADFSRRGLERAACFSWRRTAERTIEAYEHAARD